MEAHIEGKRRQQRTRAAKMESTNIASIMPWERWRPLGVEGDDEQGGDEQRRMRGKGEGEAAKRDGSAI